MATEPSCSRRDFMKLSAASLAALFRLLFLPGCGPRPDVLPYQEISPLHYNPDAIIYKGRVTALSDPILDSHVVGHLGKINKRLETIKQGIRPENPDGYLGDPFPDGWELDFKRKMIIVDEADDGKLVTQVVVPRKSQNDFSTLFHYSDKSVLIVIEGNEKNPVWFDNVESKKTEIKIDAKRGRVYQITQDSPGLVDRLMRNIGTNISVTGLDLRQQNPVLSPLFLPFSDEFINTIGYFLVNLKKSIPQEILGTDPNTVLSLLSDYMVPWIFGTQSSETNIETVFDELTESDFFKNASAENLQKIQDLKKEMINRFKEFAPDVPVDIDTAMTLMMLLRQQIEKVENPEVLEQILQRPLNESNDRQLIIPSMTASSEITNALSGIIKREILLPRQLPELYLIKVGRSLNPNEQKWVLLGRYEANDYSIDETIWTTRPNNYSPGEIFFNFGEVNENILGREQLVEIILPSGSENGSHNIGLLKNMGPFKNIYDENFRLDGWEVESASESVFKIRSEFVRLYWDPADQRLYTGFKIPNGQIIELHYDDPMAKFIQQVDETDNRDWSLLGKNPQARIDVTDKYLDLMRRGYNRVSELALLPGMDAIALTVGLGNGSYTNYSSLEKFISAESLPSLSKLGDETPEVNSLVIVFANTGIGKNTICSYYSGNDFIDSTEVPNDIILGVYEIKEINGQKMVVIAKNGKNIYTVPLEATMFIGVKSDSELVFKQIIKIAPWIMVAYGGYRFFTNPFVKGVASITGIILEKIYEILSKIILVP